MPLSTHKLAAVKTLVETVPDETIVGLNRALSGASGMGAMGSVRDMVRAEATERAVRNTVLAPVAGLCRSGRRVGLISFPQRVMRRMWLGLKSDSPALVAEVSALYPRMDPAAPPPAVLDALCALAGAGMRSRAQPDFAAAAAACDAALPAGADTMASCLDLAPVVRSALPQLDGWVGRMTEERAAVARLAFQDAVEVSADGGPKFVEMLASRLEEPWQALRIIAIVMDRPNEGYLAASELAPLAIDVFDDIDDQLLRARGYEPSAGVAAGREAGRAIHQVALGLTEFADCVELSREGPWGKRVSQQKLTLARTVEAKLAGLDALVGAALPMETIRFAGRMTKTVPALSRDPDDTAVTRARSLLSFAEEIRPAAGLGGFGSARTKALDQVGDRLANYTEDLLLHLRAEDAGNLERARGFLEVATGFVSLAKGEQAAQVIRRRAAMA